ncbi:bifunctional 4-hydroxy-3-methylbut-2-enyl diphosphate reductase/30S ribosomal protein S1 [Fervidobacterium nodosum]|uniref:Hydroxymethylbutenyl pyrophosphate reductase n=1 Tax=Fervidobacterium nodosum (strain ATCC 35602 / DSM 5306 / Rt17-B1) TaxID=381764 RepID=A7HME7_FERNB|nr:bifunctional 4-hydroxy-3-methylbut-2-enyl diphosphate reductase/30S ribosomal protein S1 [Fervidobacterium nodosum]ABS61080.1 hydroxymethylbutenyl pyrophosphate reductase [Fervidobacterium nodosum Rt17-B1]
MSNETNKVNLEIIVGQYGFCFGVDNAVREIIDHLNKGENLFTDGEVVHNKNVLEELKRLGLKYSPQENGTFVVRAHGLPPEKLNEISKNYKVIDLTCPIVQNLFALGKKLSKEGYKVVAFGKKDHAEMVAFAGHVKNSLVTTEPLPLLDNKIAIISQTTSSSEKFALFIEEMKKLNKGKEIKVINTICKVTIEREEQAKKLAQICNFVVVVGGKNSSNTKKLFEIAYNYGKAVHIESINEINEIEEMLFREKSKDIQTIKIGLISGTSTYSKDVEHILKYLVKNYGGRELYMEDLNNLKQEVLEESFEQLLKEHENMNQVGRGKIVEGIVTEITPTGLTIDLGGKVTGVVPLEELFKELNEYKVGEQIKVRVEKINEEDGTAILSAKKPMEKIIFDEIQKAKENGKPVSGKIIERIKGGYRVILENVVEAFLPGSESNIREDEEIPREKMQFAVISYETRGRKTNIVVSRKKLFQKLIDEFFSNRKPGDVVEGIVESISDNGAFVKIAGITTGFIPNSEISYNTSIKAKDALTVGKIMKFLIKEINPERKRILLSLKALLPDPWENVAKKYQIGQTVTGVVTSVKPFGFFVKIEDGVEGFVPIEEVFWGRKGNINEVVSINDFVKVQILEINPEKRQMKLSYKSVIGDPWEKIAKKLSEGDISEGKVAKVLPNGVIIEIEPEVTAFCNISEVSWNFVDNIEDVIKEGESVKFQVLKIDPENKKIRVSIRKAKPNPWKAFANAHKEGDIIKVKVIKAVEKGYIGLCEEIEVYIPKSQVYENLNLGDEIDGKIIKLEEQKDIYKIIVSPKAYENSLATNKNESKDFEGVTLEGKISDANAVSEEKQNTNSYFSREE